MELSLQFRTMMMEGKCGPQRGRVPGTGAAQGAKGHVQGGSLPSSSVSLPIHQSLTPAWHSGDQIHLGGSQGKYTFHSDGLGREGDSSHPVHNPAPHLKTQDLRPSWPCLVDNLDRLTWQQQVCLRAPAQGNRLG